MEEVDTIWEVDIETEVVYILEYTVISKVVGKEASQSNMPIDDYYQIQTYRYH